jgi:hypothetical protein
MVTGIRQIGVMVLVISSAAPAFAQPQDVAPPAQDLADLRERIASELWVYRGSTPIHGFLTRLTKTDLTLIDEDNQEQVIPLESVWKIERSGDPIWNGFAIGGSIGLAAGIGLSAELRGHVAAKATFAVYSAGIYGLIGAAIDAMHVGKTAVYEAPGRKQALTIAPSHDLRGAMVGWRVEF